MTPVAAPRRSTAAARRPAVLEAAVRRLAAHGWSGTTVADVAADAGISTAYVLKLFPSKERLLLDAIEEGYARIAAILGAAADGTGGGNPAAVLAAMAEAYAHLITDRTLLLLQVQAQAACTVPAVAAAVRRGMDRVVGVVAARSAATDEQVQQFLALGQLCHLAVSTGLFDDDGVAARIITLGLRHYG